MLAEKIKDRIRLLEIVDSFGETGASFERIRKEWGRARKAGHLTYGRSTGTGGT